MSATTEKNKLLLHICCAGCGAFVSQSLAKDFDVTLFYYNPNIFPVDEYERRVEAVKKIAEQFKLELIISDYNHEDWLKKIAGHEKDLEKGERCLICYRDRLNKAAEFASKNNFTYFTSTLTVSPHKLAKEILKIGDDLANIYNINFLAQDFKKQDGFKKATVLSRELGLYRQNYCGCEFSRKEI
jgi:epoxyqueuosine reductase